MSHYSLTLAHWTCVLIPLLVRDKLYLSNRRVELTLLNLCISIISIGTRWNCLGYRRAIAEISKRCGNRDARDGPYKLPYSPTVLESLLAFTPTYRLLQLPLSPSGPFICSTNFALRECPTIHPRSRCEHLLLSACVGRGNCLPSLVTSVQSLLYRRINSKLPPCHTIKSAHLYTDIII